jgi:hypothetical protein
MFRLPEATPTSENALVPAPVVPTTPTSPLAQMATTLANKPTSRREFLQQTGAAAARQMIPDMLVPTMEIAKPLEAVAKTMSVVPDDIAAKQIADYAATVFNDSHFDDVLLNKAHDIVHGVSSEWKKPELTGVSLEDLDLKLGRSPGYSRKLDVGDYYSQLGYGDIAKLPDAAKILGLDLNSVSASTGLPMETVKRLVRDDSTLLQSLIESGSNRGTVYSILEDGRPKEAWEMTSLDSMKFSKYAKAAVKKHGPDADEEDLFAEATDLARRDFIKNERRVKKEDYVSQSIDEQINPDDLYDDVWEQAIDEIDEKIYRAVQRAIKASKKP